MTFNSPSLLEGNTPYSVISAVTILEGVTSNPGLNPLVSEVVNLTVAISGPLQIFDSNPSISVISVPERFSIGISSPSRIFQSIEETGEAT